MTTTLILRASLGPGQLNWLRTEGVSDRYGYVNLWKDGQEETYELPEAGKHQGKRGKLIAVVKETRNSTHIGDMFHGIGPSTPDVNDEIILGEGTLDTYTDGDGWTCVGLKPDGGRDYHWLDVPMLYRAHDQIVELFFEYEMETEQHA